MAKIARSPVDVLLGEAGGRTIAERYRDMLAIASVMSNRAAATKTTLESVVSAATKGKKQFDAYGRALPAGTESLRPLAEMALNQVQTSGPTTTAMFMATADAVSGLPKGVVQNTQTESHVYFDDPQGRAILTSQGYISPDMSAVASAYAPAPGVSSAKQAIDAMSGNSLGTAAQTGVKDRLGRQPIGQVDFDSIGLNPHFAARMKDYAAAAQNLGLNLSVDVNNARRTPEQQAAIQAAGYSKTKNSYHIPGFALDVSATKLNALDQPDPATQAAARQLAASMGLGLLNPSFDPAHMQVNVPGLSASKLMSMPVDAFGNVQLSPEQALAVRSSSVPTPTARPDPEMAVAAAPTQSVKTSTFGPPAGTVNDMPDTAGIGFFGGMPGAFAGVPAHSVKTTSFTPDMAIAGIDANKTAYAPDETPASKALANLASEDDKSFTEVAGTPVGQAAVSPSNAYATTNLPGFGYTPTSIAAPPMPEPVEIAPAPAIATVAPYTAPAPVAPKSFAAPAPSMPSGTRAALDFHAGLNNAAVASNGNTLTRDAMGYSYNYSPQFDVTTISNPAGDTVGVKKGFVTADSADAGTSSTSNGTGGFLDGLGKAFGGIGDTIGGMFSKDNVSNAVVGGLGGLGGAAVGGLLGPVGSVIGSAIGRNLAVAHNPFASAQPGMFTVNTFDGPMSFASPVGGLGFPSAPKGIAGALGGTQSNRSPGEMRGISPRAADAIGKGQGGLY